MKGCCITCVYALSTTLLGMQLKALLRICIRKQIPSNFIQQELIQDKLKCIFLLLGLTLRIYP